MSWINFAFLALLSQASAFPTIFVARYAKECTDHPYSDFGKVHEYSKIVDKDITFSLTTQSGKAVSGAVCAGDSYNLQISFGSLPLRNYLLTTSHGSLTADNNDCDAWCDNRICSKSPTTQGKAVLQIPKGTAPGTQVSVKITSANGRTPTPGSTLRSSTLNLVVDGSCASKSSSSSSKGSAPVSTSSSGTAASPSAKKVSQKQSP